MPSNVTLTSGYSSENAFAYSSNVPAAMRSVRHVITLRSPAISPSIVLSADEPPPAPPAQPASAIALTPSNATVAENFLAMCASPVGSPLNVGRGRRRALLLGNTRGVGERLQGE